MKMIFTAVLIVIALSACSTKKIESSKYQSKAFELFKESQMSNQNTDSLLNQAIMLLDRAIEIEPMSNTYGVKATYQMKMRKYEAAISTFRDALEFNSKFQSARLAIGILYDKLGDSKRAKQEYESTLNFFNNFTESEKETLEFISNKAALLILFKGKAKAMEYINGLISKYPDKTDLLMQKQFVEQMDREQILNML